MGGMRTAGAILGIVGAGFILAFVAISFVAITLWTLNQWIIYMVLLTIGVLALVGGILTLTKENSGGGILLAGGIIAVVCGVVWFIFQFDFLELYNYSILGMIVPYINYLFGITLEGIIIFIGGILAVAGKE